MLIRKSPIAERPVFHGKEDLRRMYLECFELEDKYFLNFEYEIVVDSSFQSPCPSKGANRAEDKLKAKLDEMEQ